ncbi:MAG TPA: peroxide stress protein YaaA [Gammaproteobacteria bacterium]|nr:peroxide stress protein YaaA [Gammaproteobacteria bacterium]|tara:strand:+ start:8049 stop:8834 length:786 start_codon:yes stop_codon:yes gene_type:complete
MLLVVSPAKSLDFENKAKTRKFSQPEFLKESRALIKDLRKLKPDDLSELMNISSKLADENHQRFANWHTPFDLDNAKQAIFAFRGDVYLGLQAEEFSTADLNFAQDHLRILSGLYGILRPLDLMQAYRLEMGRKFRSNGNLNLYEFWGDKLTKKLNEELESSAATTNTLVNLASNEYFNSIDEKLLNAEVITPVFKDWSNGKYRIVSFFAKKARGQMTAHIIKNRLKTPESLTEFATEGYRFDQEESSGGTLVFKRKQTAA